MNMDSIFKLWSDAMKTDEANWIIAIFGLVTCVLVSYYFVKLFRDMALGGGASENVSDLADFQRLHSEGKLAPYEYDQLKKTIPKHVESHQPSSPQPQAPKTIAEMEAMASKKLDGEGVVKPDFSEVDESDSRPDDTDEIENENKIENENETTDEAESEQDTNGNA
jgi:hypothetical protein